MKFNPYTGITWSLLELENLLEDENSQVHYERMKKHLGLHPFHMNDLSKALNEILSSGLNAYDIELQGFLLAYKNPKLLTMLGDIFYDSCFIHIDIEADFYIFRPQVGNLLKGIVHKKGVNYIGVLMHKAFNVSILRPENAEEWPGDMVNIGQEVRFKVTHLDFNSRLPFIRGIFNQTDYLQGCKLPLHITSNGSFYEANESDDTDSSNVVKCQYINKKKRKSKEINKQVSLEEHVINKKKSFNSEDTKNEDNKKNSKKKLKKSEESMNETEKDNEHLDISYDDANFLNDDVTSIKKKKKHEKSSKRKFAEISNISNSELDYNNITVKIENNISNSETESNIHVKKSKKHFKKSKYSIDGSLNTSVYSEVQELENEKHSDNEFRTSIKSEKLFKSNNIEKESANHRHKSFNKRIKKSLTDSESESDNNVKIKIEKSGKSENMQEKSSKEQNVKVKSEKSMLNNETDNEIGSTKKHKKKRTRTPEVEEDYENVKIKKEKLGSYEVSTSKKSLKNKHINNDNCDDFNEEYEIKHENITKKSHKKSIVNNSETEPEETQIKAEKRTIKNEFNNQDVQYLVSNEPTYSKSLKKRSKSEINNKDVKPFKNSELDDYLHDQSNIYSSPKKRSKKFKETNSEFLSGNVRIKTERSSSIES